MNLIKLISLCINKNKGYLISNLPCQRNWNIYCQSNLIRIRCIVYKGSGLESSMFLVKDQVIELSFVINRKKIETLFYSRFRTLKDPSLPKADNRSSQNFILQPFAYNGDVSIHGSQTLLKETWNNIRLIIHSFPFVNNE